MKRIKRRDLLERAEEAILEHIPKQYQKAITWVCRLGLSMSIVGFIGMTFGLLASITFFTSKNTYPIESLITHISVFFISLGIVILGIRYMKLKMRPPNAFGWALLIGLICLVLTGFFGFAAIAVLMADMAEIFGEATIIAVGIVYLTLMLLSLFVLVNAIYYVFFAHKGYEKWYKDYAKRNHIGEEAKLVKKSQNSHKSDEYTDDDL